jgi:hypothetical protein
MLHSKRRKIIMSDAISGIVSGQPAYQPQQAASQQPAVPGSAPSSKDDIVTISAQGKQATQQPAPYSPTEEKNESNAQKVAEAQAGRK